jgi:hypothetical protein
MAEDVSGVGWVYLRHKETGGHSSFPDAPGVLEFWGARGWEKVDEPEDTPFVPARVDTPGDDGWVELTHSVTKARHLFPSNPEALAGAVEVGWELPKPPKTAPEPAPSKPTKKAAPSATEKEE